MRQQLPEDAPAALYVADAGHLEVNPGDTFEAPFLVPGCVSLEPPAAEAESGQESPAEASAPDDSPAADEAAEAVLEPPEDPPAGEATDDQPAGPARAAKPRSTKGPKP